MMAKSHRGGRKVCIHYYTFQCAYCFLYDHDKTIQIFSIYFPLRADLGTANTHTRHTTQFIFAIDKRFVGVEAKIEAKMNCRIFDIFDLTGIRYGIWFKIICRVYICVCVFVHICECGMSGWFCVSHTIVLMYIS